MLATPYKVWAKGPAVGHGATCSITLGVAGVAKTFNEKKPFVVANELLCGHLARGLLLPVPPGFIVEHAGSPYHVSLDFNLAGERLPPADTAAIICNLPTLALGVLLFDVWIANGDRHRGNMAYDKDSGKMHLFDHSHALFDGGNENEARAYLDQARTKLSIDKHNKHCLASEITTLDGLDEWERRIQSIPDFYVEEAVKQAVSVGLPESATDCCLGFLLERRSKIVSLVLANKVEFPKIQERLWDDLSKRNNNAEEQPNQGGDGHEADQEAREQ